MTKEAAFRREAAERFRPDRLEYLFVAEAPPGDVSRYFYFDDVRQGDSLYLEVAKALFLSLSVDRLRERKARTLERMRDQGMWLIDVAEEPVPNGHDKSVYLEGWVDSLVERCLEIAPQRVVLLASSVYDAAYQRLVEAGVPVVDVRMPFPGSGRQKEFRSGFWNAMKLSGWNPDPVVLDGNCISYWLDALEGTSAPAEDDPLRDQKLALVRMFFYWPWVLSYTQGVRSEVEEIPDPDRLRRHQQWMDVHLRELPDIDDNVAARTRDHLDEFGVNEKDAKWLAEAIALRVPLVATWDQPLLGETAALDEIEVLTPEACWASLSVSADTNPRITATTDNPLSQQDWWRL